MGTYLKTTGLQRYILWGLSSSRKHFLLYTLIYYSWAWPTAYCMYILFTHNTFFFNTWGPIHIGDFALLVGGTGDTFLCVIFVSRAYLYIRTTQNCVQLPHISAYHWFWQAVGCLCHLCLLSTRIYGQKHACARALNTKWKTKHCPWN